MDFKKINSLRRKDVCEIPVPNFGLEQLVTAQFGSTLMFGDV